MTSGKTHKVQRKKCILHSIFTAHLHYAFAYFYSIIIISHVICLLLIYLFINFLCCHCVISITLFLLCLHKPRRLWDLGRPLEALPLLRFISHYDFLWCFRMVRIMIILEVEVTFIVDPLIGQVVVVLQDIHLLFYLVT